MFKALRIWWLGRQVGSSTKKTSIHALYKLTRLGWHRNAKRLLVACLENPRSEVRNEAMKAIADHGLQGVAASVEQKFHRQVDAMLNGKDKEGQIVAANATNTMRLFSQKTVSSLIACVSTADERLRRAAIHALSTAVSHNMEARSCIVPVFSKLLNEQDPEIRGTVIETLARIRRENLRMQVNKECRHLAQVMQFDGSIGDYRCNYFPQNDEYLQEIVSARLSSPCDGCAHFLSRNQKRQVVYRRT